MAVDEPEASVDQTWAPPAFDPPGAHLRAGMAAEDHVVSDPDAPVIIGVSFERMMRAHQYLFAMRDLRQRGALDLKDAVVVSKELDGTVKVTETIDPTPARAAMSGAVWSGLLGLLIGGPVGWLAGIGVGAGAGAVAAKVIDLGIPDEWVDWFKAAVEPGTSAVVILAEHVHVRTLADEASRFAGAELLYTSLPNSALEQLVEAFGGARG